MRKQLQINTNNLITSYSYHAYISAILLDDRMEETSNVWFSNVKTVNSSMNSKWLEKQITDTVEINKEKHISCEVAIHDLRQASCGIGDITGASDNFKYIYSKLEGNDGIEIKIEHIKNTYVWSKAGLMLRESLDSKSKYIFIFATPSVNGVVIQRRERRGENPVYEKVFNSEFPVWLRIERNDDNIILYCGSHKDNWDYVETIQFKFESEVYMGIALCSPDENAYLNWYLTSYIQLSCYKDFSANQMPMDFNLSRYRNGEFDFYSHCPYISVQNISNSLIEILERRNENIIELIISFLDNENYVDVLLNEFFIPDRRAFGKFNRYHTNLIYGYDRLNRTFDIVGYTKGNFFRQSKMSFEQFMNAYVKNENERISLIRQHHYYHFNFNLEMVIRQLTDFINSIDSTSCLSINRNHEDNIVHGVEVYDYLIKNLHAHQRDIRPLHVVYEHKKLMLMRLEFMRRKKYISENTFQHLYQEYKLLETLALITRNLQLKNRMRPHEKYIENISENIMLIKSKEIELITLLINDIKKRDI